MSPYLHEVSLEEHYFIQGPRHAKSDALGHFAKLGTHILYKQLFLYVYIGDVTKRLECWTCNPEDPNSSPTLTASWICFTENLSFKSSATLVNSQLVCLQPVGILNPVMFNLYVDLIISCKPIK